MYAFENSSFHATFPAPPSETRLPDGSVRFEAGDGERTLRVTMTRYASDAAAIAQMKLAPASADGATITEVPRDIDGAKGRMFETVGAVGREWTLRVAFGSTLFHAVATTTAPDDGARALLLTFRLPRAVNPVGSGLITSGSVGHAAPPPLVATQLTATPPATVAKSLDARAPAADASAGTLGPLRPSAAELEVKAQLDAARAQRPRFDRAWYQRIVDLLQTNALAATVEARLNHERITPEMVAHAVERAQREESTRSEYTSRMRSAGLGTSDGRFTESRRAAVLFKALATSNGNPPYPQIWIQNALAILEDRVDLQTIVMLTQMPLSTQQTIQQFSMSMPQQLPLVIMELTQQLKIDAALACPRADLTELVARDSARVSATPVNAESAADGARGARLPVGWGQFLETTLRDVGVPANLAQGVAHQMVNDRIARMLGMPVPGSTVAQPMTHPIAQQVALDPKMVAERLLAELPALEAETATSRHLVARVFGITCTDAEWSRAYAGENVLAARIPWTLEDFLPVAEVAFAWFDKKKLGAAYIAFEALCAVRPDSAYFHFMRGCSLQNAGRAEEAIAAFSRTIAIEPHIAALQKRGELHWRAHRMREAAKDLEAAIALDVEEKDGFAARARELLSFVPHNALE